ncbi:MAG: RNA 2'-phosphotransferase [Pseudomonas sp.]|uniref:RNA 2'-phosphotransferase n=1 Tax=Pseudomonas sp. TaxID=306 RepID=UPI003393169E
MSDKGLTETSKFLSYILRHEPHSIGLTLDSEGWGSIDALIAGAAGVGRVLDRRQIEAVVQGNDKKRFSLSDDGLQIRAVQGHSTATVSLQYVPKTPPACLYHGTATRFLPSIEQQGLVPGSRHHVHLSEDAATAIAVGRRYGQVVLLKIDALAMQQAGLAFYQADNGVWLTDHVPIAFIHRGAEPDQ